MIPQDFFESAELAELVANPWDSSLAEGRFNVSLVQSLRSRSLETRPDLEAALALAALVQDELMAYGTGGGQRLSDDDMGLSLSALRAVTKRLGVAFEPPYRNFTTFRTYWLRNDAQGSWQARRDLLETLFEPLHRELIRMEELTFEGLAKAVSPKQTTGWPAVPRGPGDHRTAPTFPDLSDGLRLPRRGQPLRGDNGASWRCRVRPHAAPTGG